MHIFVTQTDTDIGTTSTVYQITSHDCGGRLKPPTIPPPPPPPEIPQKRSKNKQKRPIPPRDIHRQGYADATDPLQAQVLKLTQPYVVSKRIHIDDWGNTLRLAEAAPTSQLYPYHATPPVTRQPPRHRSKGSDYETQRDAFWRNSLLDPSPDSSPVFSPVNWTYMAYKNEGQPSLQQQSEQQQLSGSAPQQRGEEATNGDTKGERDYYNWSLFRSALNKLPSFPSFPLVREAQPPPLPPRLPPRTTKSKSKSSPRCQLRTNQSMKFSDRQRSRDYFMEADSIVGVVPSVDHIPSSESSQFLPPVDEHDSPHDSPRHVQPHASTMKPRSNSPDFAEFDAFALDTMEEDSTPQGGSPVLPHNTPVSYSRMSHGGNGWDDVSADDIHPGYMNMPLSSYSKVTVPQYRNLSALRSQGFPETQPHSLEGVSEGQTSVSTYDDTDRLGGRHSDCNLSDSDHGDLSQEGGHHGYNKEDSNTTQHQQPGVDVVQKLDSANTSAEASKSESFHVNAETGELSPIYADNQLSSSEAAQDHTHQPGTGPSGVGHAHGTVLPDSSQPHGARPIPKLHSPPADNPLYASSPPDITSMAGVLPSTLSGSAPPRSPKPLVRPKPVTKPASVHPSSSAKEQSAKQTQRGGPSPTLTRPLQEGNTPTPPKLTKPTFLPHPPPEKAQMKVTGNVAASVSHFQAKLMANQATGCHGDENPKTPSFGNQQRLLKGKTMSPQAPPTGTRHPPPPAPKPTRTIYH